jgi:hypothetical protein
MSAVFLLSLVLPSDHSPLPLASPCVMLLKAYLATSAGLYISRGNGPIPIEEFYSATSQRCQDRLTSSASPLSAPGGPWWRIIENAVAYPEEHLPNVRPLGRPPHGLSRWQRRGRDWRDAKRSMAPSVSAPRAGDLAGHTEILKAISSYVQSPWHRRNPNQCQDTRPRRDAFFQNRRLHTRHSLEEHLD